MSRDLVNRHCVPFERTTSLSDAEVEAPITKLDDWKAVGIRYPYPNLKAGLAEHLMKTEPKHHILKDFQFLDVAAAMSFINQLALVSGEENHFPDIHLIRNKVRIEFRTHEAGGLTENDFIMAAKCDSISR